MERFMQPCAQFQHDLAHKQQLRYLQLLEKHAVIANVLKEMTYLQMYQHSIEINSSLMTKFYKFHHISSFQYTSYSFRYCPQHVLLGWMQRSTKLAVNQNFLTLAALQFHAAFNPLKP